MAFILRAAFEIVNRVGGIGEGLSGIGQLFFRLCFRSREQPVGFVGLGWHSAHAADDGGGFLDAITIQVQDEGKPQSRTFFKLKF